MTTYLSEVPGARERPSNCSIQIQREVNGTTTIIIPSRGVSPFVLVLSCIGFSNLVSWLLMGFMLLLAHRNVLFMAQILPGGLPFSLRPYHNWVLVALLLAETLGFWTLAAVLRPLSMRETLILEPEWLSLERREWGRIKRWQAARDDLRGFLLKRDPLGMDASALTVQARGEQWTIGEFLREADREWLVSVGNALLERQD